MKKTLCIIIILTCFFIVRCDSKTYHWSFYQSQSEIINLSIIDANNPFEFTTLKEISMSLKNTLISDIEKLEYKKYGPNLHTTHGVCILIEFKNGEYDIISHYEPMHVMWDSESGNLDAKISWLKCDKKQFDALIDKYMQ
ncbi:MAG: hypothetical protein IKL79_00095 [Clostridia bacterium]|nr:hypothetical protein [Clostridia bacterium]